MITDPCAPWKGLLALHAVGRTDATGADGVEDHLATCASCRAEAGELADVSRALSFLAGEQWERLATRDDPPKEPTRRRRPVRLLVASAVAIVVAGVIAAVTLGGSPVPSKTLTLAGQPGVRATVALSAQGTGTIATLDVTGERAGQVFTVSMGSATGSWWVAGSYRATGAPGGQVVHLSCGLAPARITGVWVADQAGRVVLSGTTA